MKRIIIRYESAVEPHYIEYVMDLETRNSAKFTAPDGARITITKVRRAE